MLCRLAALSGIGPQELSDRWTSGDVTLMRAYTEVEPWGQQELEYYAAMICSVVASAQTGKPFAPSDFMRNVKTLKAKGDGKQQLKVLAGKHRRKTK